MSLALVFGASFPCNVHYLDVTSSHNFRRNFQWKDAVTDITTAQKMSLPQHSKCSYRTGRHRIKHIFAISFTSTNHVLATTMIAANNASPFCLRASYHNIEWRIKHHVFQGNYFTEICIRLLNFLLRHLDCDHMRNYVTRTHYPCSDFHFRALSADACYGYRGGEITVFCQD